MERKRIIELILVGLWLTIAIVLTIRYTEYQVLPVPEKLTIPTLPDSQKGKRYDVKKITVLRGDSFDFTLKENERVLGKLNLNATEDAKSKVIDLLNHISSPVIVLQEKQSDGRWIIDLLFIKDEKEINLSSWLISNNLVYK